MTLEVISKIDPTGNGDFLTLDAWKDAKKGNLTTRNTVEIAEIYSGGSVFGVRILASDGWVTDSTRFPWIRAAPGHEHGGIWTESKALIKENSYGYPPAFQTDVGWCRFGPGITIYIGPPAGQWLSEWLLPFITNVPAGQPVLFDGLYLYRNRWTAQGCMTISGATTEAELVIRNCVILHTVNNDGNWYPAICVFNGKGHIKVYNTVVIAGNDQGHQGGGCMGFNNPVSGYSIESQACYLHSYGSGTSFVYGSGVTKGSHDATSTDEALDSDLRSIAYDNTTFRNVTLNSEDMHLASGNSPLVGTGIKIVGVPTDFEGHRRAVEFDIGADQIDRVTVPTIIIDDNTPTAITDDDTPTAVTDDGTPTTITDDASPTAITDDNTPTAVTDDDTPTAVLDEG